jgi:hypothetical protein
MTIKLSTGLRNAIAGTQGFAGALADGVIEIYTGAQPTTADSAVTGMLLGTVTLAGGAFTPGSPTNGLALGAPVAGVVSKAADLWQFTGVATGAAGWFRYKGNAVDTGASSTTLPRMDGSIATSGGDMNLSNLSITVGAPNTIDAFSFTVPAQ